MSITSKIRKFTNRIKNTDGDYDLVSYDTDASTVYTDYANSKTLDTKLSEIDTSINNINKKTASNITFTKTSTVNANNVQDAITTVDGRVTETNTSLSTLSGKVSTNTNNISTISSKVTTNTTNITNINKALIKYVAIDSKSATYDSSSKTWTLPTVKIPATYSAGDFIHLECSLKISESDKGYFTLDLYKPPANTKYYYNVGGYYYDSDYNGSVFVTLSTNDSGVTSIWFNGYTKIHGEKGNVISLENTSTQIWIYGAKLK